MGMQASAGVVLPAFTLWWREIVRFYRQPTRVVGVLASPLVFWLVIGSGFGTSFRSGGGPGQQHYLDYFYPGALIMIVLFTSIFTMMSVIEDRKEGFLLSVLVAPVPRSAIVLGKVLGGAAPLSGSRHDLSNLGRIRRRSSGTSPSAAGRSRSFSSFWLVVAPRARLDFAHAERPRRAPLPTLPPGHGMTDSLKPHDAKAVEQAVQWALSEGRPSRSSGQARSAQSGDPRRRI